MSALSDLLVTLSPAQRAAINLIHLSLDCFNSADGTGLFSGVERYATLASRAQISAVQAGSLPSFWALLLRRMQWPVPPKAMDARVLSCIGASDGRDVLRALATETASVVTLARMAHDEGKAARKAERAEMAAGPKVDQETGELL